MSTTLTGVSTNPLNTTLPAPTSLDSGTIRTANVRDMAKKLLDNTLREDALRAALNSDYQITKTNFTNFKTTYDGVSGDYARKSQPNTFTNANIFSGATTFTGTVGATNINVSNQVTTRFMAVSDDATIGTDGTGNLIVHGTSHLDKFVTVGTPGNTTSIMTVNGAGGTTGNWIVGGGLSVQGGDVYLDVTNQYRYSGVPKTLTWHLDLSADKQSYTPTTGRWGLGAETAPLPLALPDGGTLIALDIFHDQSMSGGITFKVKKFTMNWPGNTLTITDVATATSSTTTGSTKVVKSINSINMPVNNATERYEIQFTVPSGETAGIYGVRVYCNVTAVADR